MASPLDGQIRKQIAKGFKGKLLNGTVGRVTASGGLDANGDPLTSTVTQLPFEGFVETWSTQFRTAHGIPDTDTGILIIADTLKGYRPKADDTITFPTRGETYVVRRIVEIDPAVATFRIAGYVA